MSDFTAEWRESIQKHLLKQDEEIAATRAAVVEVKKNTDEIVSFFDAGKGFFKVMGWFGHVAKWGTIVGGAIGAAWAALHWGGK